MTTIEELEERMDFHDQRYLSDFLINKEKRNGSSLHLMYEKVNSHQWRSLVCIFDKEEGYQFEALLEDGTTHVYQNKYFTSYNLPNFKIAKEWFRGLEVDEQ